MLSKWVRYYTNNWRVGASQVQTVRSALSQCYWQGFIGWSELLRCERMLNKTPPQTPCDLYPANDLVIAISHIGKTIKDRYKVVDIQAFVDQGIVFKAHKGSEIVSLLCDTSQTPANPQYTELFLIEGNPLPVWIASQYPTGLPSSLANLLLQQIYQMLSQAKRKDEWIDSIHTGQFFIDPDTLQLQHIPFSHPIQPYMRGQMYLGENSGYRLIAIAYELYTGCVPGNINQIHQVLKACKNLQQWQKVQMERCLSGKRSVSLGQAALILNANKKYVYRDTALLALASVFALAAIIWQGTNYAPELFKPMQNAVVDQTIVLEQGTQDQHVNLLKAAFFTQIEEKNFQGARMSWQALQKILPNDDIFIQQIGPELLATEVVEMQAPLPEPVALIQPETVMPYIPDEIVPLPPLPKSAPSLESLIEAVIDADPCEIALDGQKNNKSAACMDQLSSKEAGPRLLAMQTQDKQLVMTQQAISIEEYNQYCKKTANCEPLEMEQGLDLELSEIETTVEDYNSYCITSGLCEPLESSVEPVRALSAKEIEHYAAWLSSETGYHYRLPTANEWREMSSSIKTAQIAEWVLDDNGELITTYDLDSNARKRRNIDADDISFRLVRENKS
ncbi:MAG: hypothetical protein ABSF18_03300 [Gammaproteobacteria bacterium]